MIVIYMEEEEKKIKRVKVIKSIPVYEIKPGEYFKRYIQYLGTIVGQVRSKIKKNNLRENEYLLPVKILSATIEDGFFYPGQLTEIPIRPINGKFTDILVVEIKFHKNKKTSN